MHLNLFGIYVLLLWINLFNGTCKDCSKTLKESSFQLTTILTCLAVKYSQDLDETIQNSHGPFSRIWNLISISNVWIVNANMLKLCMGSKCCLTACFICNSKAMCKRISIGNFMWKFRLLKTFFMSTVMHITIRVHLFIFLVVSASDADRTAFVRVVRYLERWSGPGPVQGLVVRYSCWTGPWAVQWRF